MFQTFNDGQLIFGFYRNHLDVGIKAFETATCPHQGSAGPDTGHKMRDGSAGLLPYLDPRCVIMWLPVDRIVVLVRIEV